jgi:hypothetical protein
LRAATSFEDVNSLRSAISPPNSPGQHQLLQADIAQARGSLEHRATSPGRLHTCRVGPCLAP